MQEICEIKKHHMVFFWWLSSFNLAGAKASWASIDMTRSTLNDSLNSLYVRLPSSVWTSVWVRNLNTESNTLTADIAFCHFTAPPFESEKIQQYYCIINFLKNQVFFEKKAEIFICSDYIQKFICDVDRFCCSMMWRNKKFRKLLEKDICL